MRVLMIDNYDSFTYNIVQYLQELGAEVLVHRNDQISLEEIEALNPDRLMISPGPCTPNEAGISIAAIKHFAGKLPILGVCLGHQALAVARGGRVGAGGGGRSRPPRGSKQPRAGRGVRRAKRSVLMTPMHASYKFSCV